MLSVFLSLVLADILASEHEEAIYAAMRAFKSLINACIDESLIKQGVDQIMTNAHNAARRSGPTIIEKVCAIIESLLGYHYTAVWDVAFQVVSTMFDKLGICIALSSLFCYSTIYFQIAMDSQLFFYQKYRCIIRLSNLMQYEGMISPSF